MPQIHQIMNRASSGRATFIALALILCISLLIPLVGSPVSSSETFPSGRSENITPNMVRASPLSKRQVDTAQPHILAASYYSLRNNLKTTITLNNKGPQPLEVKPTLFNMMGDNLEVLPVIVPSNSHKVIDMSEWAPSTVSTFAEGSVQLFYQGKALLLGAQVKMVDESASLIFDEQLVEPAMMFSSSRLESVWWLPSRDCQVALCLSNTTDTSLLVAVAVQAEAGQKIPPSLTLQAHETRSEPSRDAHGANQSKPTEPWGYFD